MDAWIHPETLNLADAKRPYVFTCCSCNSSMSLRMKTWERLTISCPLCGGPMVISPKSSQICQKKEAEAN